jgi:hypothetical protein
MGTLENLDETTREEVFDMAVILLDERSGEEGFPDTAAWTTGSEIAHRTGIDKHQVFEALRSLNHEKLYIREREDVGHDIEVLGIVREALTP